jgi:hypothetical protein
MLSNRVQQNLSTFAGCAPGHFFRSLVPAKGAREQYAGKPRTNRTGDDGSPTGHLPDTQVVNDIAKH